MSTPNTRNRHRLIVFDRREIAEILEISPALVRNWSKGNPFQIEPSIRAPGRKGAANLYALEEVYLLGVAANLMEAGLQPRLTKKVLSYLLEHSDLLQKKNRQVYLACVASPLPRKFDGVRVNIPPIRHLTKAELASLVRDVRWFTRLFKWLAFFIHLGVILDSLDLSIAGWQTDQNLFGEKASRSKSEKRRK